MVSAIPSIASEAVESVSLQNPVVMPEFKVSGLDKQITVQLRFSKRNPKLVDYAIIVDVAKGTPAETAGLKRGMGIFKLQGVYVDGLTEEEFNRCLEALPKGDRIDVSVVTDIRRSFVEEFSIPVKRIKNPGDTVAIR